jgi:hypothetical protein
LEKAELEKSKEVIQAKKDKEREDQLAREKLLYDAMTPEQKAKYDEKEDKRKKKEAIAKRLKVKKA